MRKNDVVLYYEGKISKTFPWEIAFAIFGFLLWPLFQKTHLKFISKYFDQNGVNFDHFKNHFKNTWWTFLDYLLILSFVHHSNNILTSYFEIFSFHPRWPKKVAVDKLQPLWHSTALWALIEPFYAFLTFLNLSLLQNPQLATDSSQYSWFSSKSYFIFFTSKGKRWDKRNDHACLFCSITKPLFANLF